MNKAPLATDIYSEILRGVNSTVAARPSPTARRMADSPSPLSQSWRWSWGYRRCSGPRKSMRLLANVASEDVLDFLQPAAEIAGRTWDELEHIGHPIGVADPTIAAIALVHALELVTSDTAHYQHIQNLGYP